jgi:radical SAM protein with 4Fe4S-binding SPASM domain
VRVRVRWLRMRVRRRRALSPGGIMSVFGFLKKARPLEKGIYSARIDEPEGNYRLHLRVEEGGRGVLVINASRILHMNQTATEYAKMIVDGLDVDEATRLMRSRYRVKLDTARRDFQKIQDTIHALSRTDLVCPVSYLDVQMIEPDSVSPSAPYRMDIALTYDCENKCAHCYVESKERGEPLTFEQWKEVLDKLWAASIPHVCFTGGEPTMYDDLEGLIEYAEDIGIVTGLITNGRRLADESYTRRLIDAGLDHVQITLESHDENVHDEMVGCPGAWKETVEGIRNAVKLPLYTMTNTTLLDKNVRDIEKTVEFLASLHVDAFACNGLIYSGKGREHGGGITEEELPAILRRVMDATSRHSLRFIWYTPTRYCTFNPVSAGLGIKQCSAAKLNMCIEPDGTVLPCQSYFKSAGNILTDSFDSIWNSETSRALRDREWLDEKCRKCEDLKLCGGGCPLYREGESFVCRDSKTAS